MTRDATSKIHLQLTPKRGPQVSETPHNLRVRRRLDGQNELLTPVESSGPPSAMLCGQLIFRESLGTCTRCQYNVRPESPTQEEKNNGRTGNISLSSVILSFHSPGRLGLFNFSAETRRGAAFGTAREVKRHRMVRPCLSSATTVKSSSKVGQKAGMRYAHHVESSEAPFSRTDQLVALPNFQADDGPRSAERGTFCKESANMLQ